MKNKPASLLVVFLGKALNWLPLPLYGRKVVQFFLQGEGWWDEEYLTIKQMPCNTKCRSEVICCGNP